MSALVIIGLALLYSAAAVGVGCRVATMAAWFFRDRAAAQGWSWKRQPEPDGEQWFGGALLGILAAFAWPVIVPVVAARTVLFRPPEHVRARRQAERIRQLERELGIEEGR